MKVAGASYNNVWFTQLSVIIPLATQVINVISVTAWSCKKKERKRKKNIDLTFSTYIKIAAHSAAAASRAPVVKLGIHLYQFCMREMEC